MTNKKTALSINRIKPRSTAWRTTWVVMIVVIFSLIMSIMFFWRSLYLPELKQHAFYLSNEIILLQDAQDALGITQTPSQLDENGNFINHGFKNRSNQDIKITNDSSQDDAVWLPNLSSDEAVFNEAAINNAALKNLSSGTNTTIEADLAANEASKLNEASQTIALERLAWLQSHLSFVIIDDVSEFPDVEGKFFAELFTNEFKRSIAKNIGEVPTVYFKFKPVPNLWIQVPSMGNVWIKQPVTFYANYSPGLILSWLLGVPILSLIAILTLIRQINRPLLRLRSAAKEYLKTGHTERLKTTTGPIEIRQVNQAFNQLFDTLEKNEKERTVMLAGISHDLRTPLTRMRLTAEMLSDEFFQEGLIYDIDDMDAILEQFISFMRDGSDEPLKPTDLNSIFQEIIVQFAPLKFAYTPSDLPKVPLRTLSMKRVIINLVNNAKRYGAEPIHLDAYISNDEMPLDETNDKAVAVIKKQLHIVVRDEGDGVAENELAGVMQPFVRGEQARTTQGSGLGLAIVQRIVKLHQGEVHVSNHLKGGLEVRISIPLPKDFTD